MQSNESAIIEEGEYIIYPFSNNISNILLCIVKHEENEFDETQEGDIEINSLSEDEIKEKYICQICFSNLIKVTFVLCGHSVCKLCNDRLESKPIVDEKKCPFCRSPIQLVIETKGGKIV